jgi:hypothetical protein
MGNDVVIGPGSRYFAESESGSESRLLLNPGLIRIRYLIQTKIFNDKKK